MAPHFHLGSASGLTRQAQFAAQPLGALAHADQSEMPALGGKRVVQLEAAAIIDNPQEEPACFDVQLDPDPARSGVFQDVGDGLLGECAATAAPPLPTERSARRRRNLRGFFAPNEFKTAMPV